MIATAGAGLDACSGDGLAAAGAGERRITAAGLVPGAGALAGTFKELKLNIASDHFRISTRPEFSFFSTYS